MGRYITVELKTRRAIESFLKGDDQYARSWHTEVVDENGNKQKMRPYEGALRDWYNPYLGWISKETTIDQMYHALKESGGALMLESW